MKKDDEKVQSEPIFGDMNLIVAIAALLALCQIHYTMLSRC